MKTVSYELKRDLPVTCEMDVVVIGGGPGGLGAAVMAAREGAKVLLVERYGAMGGMASYGEVHPFMPNHLKGVCLDRPIYVEWAKRMACYAPVEGGITEVYENAQRRISKDAAMLAAEDLCLEAGVKLLYHHQLVDAVVCDGKIEAAILFSKSGFSAVKGKIYVDASGDGDLAVRAGCLFEQGGPNGHCQPMTLCFKLSGVDRSRTPSGKEITALYRKARDEGRIQCPREDVLFFDTVEKDVLHFNTTRVIQKSGTDGLELSDAEIEARRQVRQYLEFFRRDVPGFENARIHSMAHHIGIRETRRVNGIARVVREDFEKFRKFPDAIARVRYPIDIHNPNGQGTEIVHVPEDQWYEIPYGSIVTRDCRNLLMAGRPISVDHAIHSSMRVMPPAISIGQAAGLAAAMAVREDKSPHDLDGVEIRRRLKGHGANL